MDWIIIILITAAVLFSAVSYAFFRFSIVKRSKKKAFSPPEGSTWYIYLSEMKKGREWAEKVPHEEVSIKSRDGLNLYGTFIPSEQSKATVLCMHGYRSEGFNDFGSVVEFYNHIGYNVLIPDERASGKSEGRYIGFGVLERFDCRDWILFLNSREGETKSVILDGVSMGAATVLLAAGLNLPANVKCIIADCGFTSAWDILGHQLKQRFWLPPFPFLYIVSFMSRLIAHYGFKDCSTVDVMRKNTIPVFFAHGLADDFVPTRMSRENYDTCTAEKELFLVENAGHALSYITARDEYQKRLIAFLSGKV